MSEQNLNNLAIAGKLRTMEEAYTKQHEENGKKVSETFYRLVIDTPRYSDHIDSVPVICSEKLLFRLDIKVGKYVGISGKIRTEHRQDKENPKKSHLFIYGYAEDVLILSEEDYKFLDNERNMFEAEGYVCKKPVFRQTISKRLITDLLIAVNGRTRSNYIPCIAWGSNAKMASRLAVGDKIYLSGRFQSRNYTKKNGDSYEQHTAYEVSIKELRVLPSAKEASSSSEEMA